jgi:nitrite reductase (NADH) large subunit
VLEDAAGRSALAQRLEQALAREVDPWHEPEKAAVDARQFVPIVAEVVA